MRTYYFCTDTAKEMESWMKVMTDAALVQAEPVKRFVPVLSRCQGKENILLESLNEEKQIGCCPFETFPGFNTSVWPLSQPMFPQSAGAGTVLLFEFINALLLCVERKSISV